MAGCIECTAGYLLDQTYGTADIPRNAIAVQACAGCRTFDGLDRDEDAARAAYLAEGMSWGFTFDTLTDEDGEDIPGHDPAKPYGEFWIVHVDNHEAPSAWCGFCGANITGQGNGTWAHDPPYGEHEEPLVPVFTAPH